MIIFQDGVAMAIIHKADLPDRDRANEVSKGLIQVFGKDHGS